MPRLLPRRWSKAIRQISWQELDERAPRLAAGFARLGLRKDSKVAVLACNCTGYIEITYPAFKLRATPINLTSVRLLAYLATGHSAGVAARSSSRAGALCINTGGEKVISGRGRAGRPQPARSRGRCNRWRARRARGQCVTAPVVPAEGSTVTEADVRRSVRKRGRQTEVAAERQRQ